MICVITGASSGIGAALARELARHGARLVLAARRAELLERLNAQLGGGHLVVETDVADPEQCRRLIERAAEQFGRLDTLIANAGFGIDKKTVDTTPQEVAEMFATNVFGTLDCIRPAVQQMRRQEPVNGWRGQIMITSSVLARRGIPYGGPYSATKSAQLSLAEALRLELAPERIAVTSVHPSATESEFDTIRQEVLDPSSGFHAHRPEFVVLFTVVQSLQARFIGAKNKEQFAGAMLSEMTALWDAIGAQHKAIILQHNFATPLDRSYGKSNHSV